MAEKVRLLPEEICRKTPILKPSSKQLCENSSKHNKQEEKKHHNVKHDW